MTDPETVTLGGEDLRKLIDNVRREERQRIRDRLQKQSEREKECAVSTGDSLYAQALASAADLVWGEWGGLHDYEPGQRHESGATGMDDSPSTEALHAEPCYNGDSIFHEGIGIEFSKERIQEWQRKCAAAVRREEIPEYRNYFGKTDQTHSRGLISEKEILRWADQILVTRAMKQRLGLHVKRKNLEHDPELHPGTDAVKGQSDIGFGSQKRTDHFDTDASRSSICITHPSSNGRVLNGTTHRHQHYIGIRIKAPDGHEICELSMSYDQFARALVTTSEVPCTLDAYWSHGRDSVLLCERVREPVSIKGRMERRLRDMVKEFDNTLASNILKILERVETGKGLTKTHGEDLVRSLNLLRERIISSTDFVIEQSMEEACDGIERVMTQVLVANTGVNPDLVDMLRLLPELPSPKPKTGLVEVPKPKLSGE